MGKIHLEDLKPGMVLCADVVERGGRILLGSGVEITKRHIDIFRKWGITEAEVENVTQEEVAALITAQMDPALLEEAERLIGILFRGVDSNVPVMRELFRLCVLRKVRHLSRGKAV